MSIEMSDFGNTPHESLVVESETRHGVPIKIKLKYNLQEDMSWFEVIEGGEEVFQSPWFKEVLTLFNKRLKM